MSKPRRHGPPDSLGRSLRLVFEDDHLLIVDKPIGMLSARMGQESGGDAAFDLVREYVAKSAPRQPRPADRKERRRQRFAWIIHRLDRDVSGLMVFAKTHDAFTSLKEELRVRRMFRRYAAVVEGSLEVDPPEAPWRWISGFLRDRGPGQRVQVLSDDVAARDKEAEHAVTYYRVLAAGHNRSLLEVRLQTGRKHQIRAHLASIGYPITGDRLYLPRKGGAGGKPIRRIMLHAAELGLIHPATGQPVTWTSPLPVPFAALVPAAESAWLPASQMPALPENNGTGTFSDEEESDAEAGAAIERAEETAPAEEQAPPAPAPAPVPTKTRRDEDGKAREKASPIREPSGDQGWNDVADWYANLVGSGASDHHEKVVLPGVLRLLAPKPGQSFLDVACGEGRLCRDLASLGVRCTGVDAAGDLIGAARQQSRAIPAAHRPTFVKADARYLHAALQERGEFKPFDLAACVLALMNIDPLDPVIQGVARCLAPSGRFVIVLLHPAFRSPGLTAWGWEKEKSTQGRPVEKQYRRVDAYLSPIPRAIVMNPGEAAHGKPAITTTTWHRPVQSYVKALCDAGLVIDAMEEWASQRTSDSGPRAAEENRARREIPMFLALRAVRR